MTLYSPYDQLVISGERRAVFLYYQWLGRRYGRVRYLDTGQRVVVNVLDMKTIEQAAIDAVREVFQLEAAE